MRDYAYLHDDNKSDRENMKNRERNVIKASQEIDRNAQVKETQARQHEILNSALKEAGLPQEEFIQLASEDRQPTARIFVDGVMGYLKKADRARDPKTGRFVSVQTQENLKTQS